MLAFVIPPQSKKNKKVWFLGRMQKSIMVIYWNESSKIKISGVLIKYEFFILNKSQKILIKCKISL